MSLAPPLKCRTGCPESAIDLTYASRLWVRTENPRGRLVTMSTYAPRQIVLSASVGGAAAGIVDPSVRIAPLRSAAHIESVEYAAAQAPADPWDPWPARRVGYGDGHTLDLFFPERGAMARLGAYLECVK